MLNDMFAGLGLNNVIEGRFTLKPPFSSVILSAHVTDFNAYLRNIVTGHASQSHVFTLKHVWHT
jgi:hypothetical protein